MGFRIKISAILLLVAAVVCGGTLSPVQAAPATYTFTGTGSGLLDGNSFSDVFFTVVIPGDTNNVEETTFGPGIFAITGLTGSINMASLGTGTFTEPLYVFNNTSIQAVGFGNFNNADLIDLFVPGVGLDTYDLRTSFGPIVDATPYFGQFVDVALDIGTLTFRSMADATFTAEVGAAPLPGAVLLFGSGLVGLVGVAWRRRRN